MSIDYEASVYIAAGTALADALSDLADAVSETMRLRGRDVADIHSAVAEARAAVSAVGRADNDIDAAVEAAEGFDSIARDAGVRSAEITAAMTAYRLRLREARRLARYGAGSP